jgi:hypothetical protein
VVAGSLADDIDDTERRRARNTLLIATKAQAGLLDGEPEVLAHFVAAHHPLTPRRDADLAAHGITQALGTDRNLIK